MRATKGGRKRNTSPVVLERTCSEEMTLDIWINLHLPPRNMERGKERFFPHPVQANLFKYFENIPFFFIYFQKYSSNAGGVHFYDIMLFVHQ